ncbi:hypothetical protein AVEN_166668-1 [Araneus ventricosus]|uniref:Uncharacterized protein n=1 Tax=Araneus ventricosus TaxID=182803 RepID=A0A4Y2JP85_ARAVE|nr:hypothetical protein AVEN_166668-1 [Araneus ventricosus]
MLRIYVFLNSKVSSYLKTFLRQKVHRSEDFEAMDIKDLKKIERNKPKQVPSSKCQQEQRVYQSTKIHWEMITNYKIRADANRRPIKEGSRSGDAQEIKKKIAAHPKQIGVNIEECISWRLTTGKTKWQEAKPNRRLHLYRGT